MPRNARKIGKVLVLGPLLLVAGGAIGYAWYSLSMPGQYFDGPLPTLNAEQKQLAANLHDTVSVLADRIGERHTGKPEKLEQAAQFVEQEMIRHGFAVRAQKFFVGPVVCRNLEASSLGNSAPNDVVIVGAHYDSAVGTPGADDNASGVAALLQLAANAQRQPHRRTLRFVAFVNEEPPHFRTKDMGSVRYAAEATKRGERIVAMLSLEMLGYYVDSEKSQRYPAALDLVFPNVGNFVAFLGNGDATPLVRNAVGSFRRNASFPALGAALAGAHSGAELSDNWAFSRHGIPSIMVTDTAMMRNPNYHQWTDTVDTLDFDRMARVVEGLDEVLRGM